MAKKFKHSTPGSPEFLGEFRRLMAERPEISDEDFMRETEAPVGPDGEYLYGPGVVLTNQLEEAITPAKLAQEGFLHDFDWNDSLFSAWYNESITPDTIPSEYEEMRSAYAVWLERGSPEDK